MLAFVLFVRRPVGVLTVLNLGHLGRVQVCLLCHLGRSVGLRGRILYLAPRPATPLGAAHDRGIAFLGILSSGFRERS